MARMKETDLTGTMIERRLCYDPITGRFISNISSSPSRQKGGPVGNINDQGYLNISMEGRLFRAHRLAWVWMTGNWPKEDIDHINGDRLDNRFVNLREATRSQNLMNSGLKARNKTGHIGVNFDKDRNKFVAQIKVNKKQKHLGRYSKLEDAVSARKAAEEIYYREFVPEKRNAWKPAGSSSNE